MWRTSSATSCSNSARLPDIRAICSLHLPRCGYYGAWLTVIWRGKKHDRNLGNSAFDPAIAVQKRRDSDRPAQAGSDSISEADRARQPDEPPAGSDSTEVL